MTGGAGGLGSATASRLRSDGWAVVILDRHRTRTRAVAAEIGAAGVTGDTCDDDDVSRAIETARAAGRLSVLVNVAGGGVGGGPTVRDDGSPHDLGSFVATITMNALGVFNATRLVAAAMADGAPDAEGRRGVVVHTASVAATDGQRGQVAYAAAKAAVAGMTLPMARDLAPLGIRVCTIAPGPMATPAMLGVRDRLDEDPAAGVVFPARMGTPAEFAELVVALVGNDHLNGEVVRLDGALRSG